MSEHLTSCPKFIDPFAGCLGECPTTPSAIVEAIRNHATFTNNGWLREKIVELARALRERDEKHATYCDWPAKFAAKVAECERWEQRLRERERAHEEALDALQATAKDAIRFQDQLKECKREVERLLGERRLWEAMDTRTRRQRDQATQEVKQLREMLSP